MSAKYSIDTVLECQLRNAQADDVVNKVSDDVPAPIPTMQMQIAQAPLVSAAPADVCLSDILNDPSLDTVLTKNKIMYRSRS